MLDKLKEEHEIILKKITDAEREIIHIRETENVRRGSLEELLNFFKDYLRDYHQVREERFLFNKLKGRTGEEFDPVVVMFAEHDLCNKLVEVMDDYFSTAGSAEEASESSPRSEDSEFCCSVTPKSSSDMLQDNLSTYIKLLKKHIERENSIIFPLAEKLFTPEEFIEIEKALVEFSFNPKKPDR